jgi:hypothetical protein
MLFPVLTGLRDGPLNAHLYLLELVGASALSSVGSMPVLTEDAGV